MRRRDEARYHVLMPDSHNRVAIDRVDWPSVLPVLRLVGAFRNALQPGKLTIALLAVVLIYLSGITIDALFGVNESNDAPGDLRAFETLVHLEAGAFSDMVASALALEHGFGPSSHGVADALLAVVVSIPYAMFDTHPWFTLLFGIDVLFVLAIASGVICRMAATQVCAKKTTPMGSAACFVSKRWAWYFLTPLMPALLIALLAGVLVLAGLVLFNMAYLEIIGSLVYGLLLLLGFVIALVSLLLIFALFLMPPALSAEASDGFDAIARSFNYVMFRPWQFAGYLIASLVYLAVVYVLVVALSGLTVAATYQMVDLCSFAKVDLPDVLSEYEPTRHESILSGGEGTEGISVSTSAWIVARWMQLLSAIGIAVLFSVFCCLQTQVYVLMRRSADGTPLDQYGGDEPRDLWQEDTDTADAQATPQAEPGNDTDAQPDPPQAGD